MPGLEHLTSRDRSAPLHRHVRTPRSTTHARHAATKAIARFPVSVRAGATDHGRQKGPVPASDHGRPRATPRVASRGSSAATLHAATGLTPLIANRRIEAAISATSRVHATGTTRAGAGRRKDAMKSVHGSRAKVDPVKSRGSLARSARVRNRGSRAAASRAVATPEVDHHPEAIREAVSRVAANGAAATPVAEVRKAEVRATAIRSGAIFVAESSAVETRAAVRHAAVRHGAESFVAVIPAAAHHRVVTSVVATHVAADPAAVHHRAAIFVAVTRAAARREEMCAAVTRVDPTRVAASHAVETGAAADLTGASRSAISDHASRISIGRSGPIRSASAPVATATIAVNIAIVRGNRSPAMAARRVTVRKAVVRLATIDVRGTRAMKRVHQRKADASFPAVTTVRLPLTVVRGMTGRRHQQIATVSAHGRRAAATTRGVRVRSIARATGPARSAATTATDRGDRTSPNRGHSETWHPPSGICCRQAAWRQRYSCAPCWWRCREGRAGLDG